MLLSRRLESVLNQSEEGDIPIALRALIDVNRVGAVIGKGGTIHQQIEDMFNVRMIIHSDNTPIGRLATIFGHPTQVARAWRDALLRMNDMKQFELNNNNKKLGLDFLIPEPLADWLVQDQALHRIHLASKAHIHLKPKPLPDTNEYVLKIAVGNIYGDCLNDFETAVRMLGQCFQHRVDLALSPLNVYYLPNSPGLPQKVVVHDNDNINNLSYNSDKLDMDAEEQWREQLLAE